MFFAGDLVLISEIRKGLEKLLKILNSECNKIKMEISVTKPKVITPEDDIITLKPDGTIAITIWKVKDHKYLGIDTLGTIFKTKQNWEKRTIRTANTYMSACKKLSTTGPDVIKLGVTAWKAAAIPSILFGCETLINSKQTIQKLEQTQSRFTKLLIGLQTKTPNICAQTETVLKFIKQNLYYKQLNYFYRVLMMDRNRWTYNALYEHIANNSKYYKYINKIRYDHKIDNFTTSKNLDKQLNSFYLQELNEKIKQQHLPIKQITELKVHKQCKENNAIISQFRIGIEPTKNYYYTREQGNECIPCWI